MVDIGFVVGRCRHAKSRFLITCIARRRTAAKQLTVFSLFVPIPGHQLSKSRQGGEDDHFTPLSLELALIRRRPASKMGN